MAKRTTKSGDGKSPDRAARIDRVFDELWDLQRGCSSDFELHGIEIAVAAIRWLLLSSGEFGDMSAKDIAAVDAKFRKCKASLLCAVVSKDKQRRAVLRIVAAVLDGRGSGLKRHLGFNELKLEGPGLFDAQAIALSSAIAWTLNLDAPVTARLRVLSQNVCRNWNIDGKWEVLNSLLRQFGLETSDKRVGGTGTSGAVHPLAQVWNKVIGPRKRASKKKPKIGA